MPGNKKFNATFTICGSSLASNSGVWSSCITKTNSSCSVKVTANPPCVPKFTINGSISLEGGCVYNWALDEQYGNPVLGYAKTCPGNCSTSKPWAEGVSTLDPTESPDFQVIGIITGDGELKPIQ